MITRLKHTLAQFRRAEHGAIYTVGFAIVLPLLFAAFFFGVEVVVHANRQFQLDRGLEVTTRAVRLNTAMAYTHDDLKTMICDNSGGLQNCESSIKLEMLPMNPRSFTGLPAMPDCANTIEPILPVRGWSVGQQHELMLMRACYNFIPVFGSLGLGALLATDAEGKGKMVAVSAFVQEPK